MRARALLVAGLIVLSGCLGSQTPEQPGNRTQPQVSVEEDVQALPTLFLTQGMTLTRQAPEGDEPNRIPMGNFYANWTMGSEQPTWTGPTTRTAYRITSVHLTFWYTSNQATATTGPQDQGFPEFVVYFGTERAPMAWASLEGPDLVRSEDVVKASGKLALPAGGLVLPAGVRPIVKIAPVQAQGDRAGELVLLVNSTETASRAMLEGEPISLPPSTASEAFNTTGVLAGSAYVTGPQEGATSANHTVEVPAGSLGLTARLTRVQGAGVADIDLELIGPDGEVKARSVTPEDDEGLALYAPNVDAIGTGTWTLRVVNYGNAAVQYRLAAHLLEPVQRA